MAERKRKDVTRDSRNIFKHYRGMSESQLKGELGTLKKHTAKYSKMGIHTTPEHEQSIKYHLSAKSKALRA
jgi:hypothetical protein